MRKLAAFYFSGTGNTAYVTRKLCSRLETLYTVKLFDISERKSENTSGLSNKEYEHALQEADTVVLAFPIYGSCPPIPMRRFVYANRSYFCGKEAIVIATQYMFSGDGAASLGRMLDKYGADVRYAEHFCMPNNICDIGVFKIRNGAENASVLEKADARIEKFARRILAGQPFRRGFNPVSHAVGYFGQRVFFRRNEKEKQSLWKIDTDRCCGCGVCVRACPVGNLSLQTGKATGGGRCVLCYRCANLCPRKAITIVGKKLPEKQYKGPDAEMEKIT